MFNEQWKNGAAPTIEDVKKFKATHAKLLVSIDQYALPIETFFGEITDDGDYCQIGIGNGFGVQYQWVARADIHIIALLDKPEPIVKEIPVVRSGMNTMTLAEVQSALMMAQTPPPSWMVSSCPPSDYVAPAPKKSYWQRIIDKIKR